MKQNCFKQHLPRKFLHKNLKKIIMVIVNIFIFVVVIVVAVVDFYVVFVVVVFDDVMNSICFLFRTIMRNRAETAPMCSW
jgi:hypothetical protein